GPAATRGQRPESGPGGNLNRQSQLYRIVVAYQNARHRAPVVVVARDAKGRIALCRFGAGCRGVVKRTLSGCTGGAGTGCLGMAGHAGCCPPPIQRSRASRMNTQPPATDTAQQHDETARATLPVWDLGDLYPGRDSEELRADLEQARSDAKAFEADYRGKLDGLARNGGLSAAIKRMEALSDLTGRLGSYAYLQYVRNTQDADSAKFLGDTSQALTDLSSRLIFFSLELNRIDDAVMEAAFAADSELARYRPWFAELRKAKPYQLEDRIEELFHEKSVTGASAWNRLFDETMAALKFKVGGKELGLEGTLNLLSDRDEKKREAAFHGLSATLHDNSRLFTHITNVLAKDKEI